MPHSHTSKHARRSRDLAAVTVPAGIGGVLTMATAVREALEGTGPAIAPFPTGPAEAVTYMREAIRPDDELLQLETDGIALVLATSGSTSTPRGVLLSREALISSAEAFGNRFGTDARWVISMPVHRVAGAMILVRSWVHGSPFEVDPSVGGAQQFTAETFTDTTRRAVIASQSDGRRLMVSLVPTQIARLLDSGEMGLNALRSYDLVLSGAAATPQPMLNRLRDEGVNVVVSYGMSETSGGCVFDGQPLDGVKISLGTQDDVEPGRISIGGPVIASGYRLRPDLDAVMFIDGRVQTQDVGKLDAAGMLHVLGRLDDVVIVGGVNVSLSAVESLVRHHPDIEDVAIIDVPDDLWGSLPVAYIVAQSYDVDRDRLLSDIRSTVADRISRAATPRSFAFLNQLPMLDSGKIDRLGLRLQAAKDIAEGRMPHPGV